MERKYYWKSPDVAIVKLDDGNVLFKSDTIAVKIESESIHLLVDKILPLLDGNKSITEIAKQLEVSENTLQNHLDLLVEKGILKAQNEVNKNLSNLEKYLDNLSIPLDVSKNMLANIRISIFGLEGEGVLLAHLLANAGAEKLLVSDPFPATIENSFLIDEYKNVSNSASRQQLVKDNLLVNHPNGNTKTGPETLSKELVDEIVKESDLAICCFDNNFLAANYWINEASIKHNKPVLYSAIKGHVSIVGPMVIPGQTACYMCYRMRSIAVADDFEIAIATEKHLNAEKKPGLSDKPLLPSSINFNSSLLYSEILKYIFSLGSPSLLSHIIEFNHIDFTSAKHYVMQMPECRACKKKTNRELPDLNDLIVSAQKKSDISQYENLLVSNKTGIITKFELFQKDISEPNKPYIYRADLSNHRFVKKKDFTDNISSGKGLTPASAKISAMGEAVERYSGACYNANELILASYNEINEPKLDPNSLVLFHPKQYENIEFQPYSPDSILGWAKAKSLVSGSDIFVPAISVFMNYQIHQENEYLFQVTSNGLAAGNCLLNSILSAAMEVIERDAFIISWHNKLPGKRFDPLTIPDAELAEYILMYKRRGVELQLYELPTDFPCHIFMAIAIQSAGDGPFAVVGLGSDFDNISAARGALIEVGQVRPALKKRLRNKEALEKLLTLLEDPQKVAELDDHDLLFASKKSAGALSFLLDQKIEKCEWIKKEISEEEKISSLIVHLRENNSDLIYYNLTPTDMQSLGLYTSRAIIPHTQPIHFGSKNIRLGGKRLFELPFKLGLCDKIKTVDEIDLFPHPLA